ncbi:hypothetical protein EON65_54425 [archaeon]|nr:MAG: hypothetical protein EON65_54425 [archaeon]
MKLLKWKLFGAFCMLTGSSQVAIASSDEHKLEKKYAARRLHHHEKIVHFVRHAEGHHNVAARNDPLRGYLRNDLEDAHITEEGLKQCQELSEKMKHVTAHSQLLVVSPMSRTLQTASHSFPHLQHKIPWVSIECIRERTGLHPCDKRRALSVYKQQYTYVDFDHIHHEEDPLFPKYTLREPEEQVKARAREFLDWLASREEREIVVVSHSNFLRILLNQVLQVELQHEDQGGKFANCEIKTYVLRLPTSRKL